MPLVGTYTYLDTLIYERVYSPSRYTITHTHTCYDNALTHTFTYYDNALTHSYPLNTATLSFTSTHHQLDVEVAYEILRRLAESEGSYEKAAAMADFESQKPSIAREINLARAKKDEKMATDLCAQLDSLSRLSYNPFDPYAEVESGGWNLEKWYYDNRYVT